MNGKKKWSKILLIFGVLIGVIGVSYALWRVSFSSTNDNSLTATCFNVSFTDQNNISIEKAYPLLDKDGKKLTPYEFTITNNCDTYVKYDINLEILNTSTLTNMDYIKLMLDDETPALVSSYDVTTKTLSNASTAYKIKTSYLDAKESKTYNLRLWLDENVTGETEGVQNNTFTSKITVNASYAEEIPKPTATEYITTLAATDTTNLATDDYGNIRYIGLEPNNYVSVDGDIWRIIGVMKDIDAGTGNQETRVKIINESAGIGEYSWDTSDSSVNDGGGINEWSQAKLMKLLNPGYENSKDKNELNERVLVNNSLFWNRASGYCYAGDQNLTKTCDFKNYGLTTTFKNLIDNAVWNTGAVTKFNQITKDFYLEERGNATGKICVSNAECNDNVVRTTTWTGKVGLMYPSDYGYATSGGSTTDRTTCLNTSLDEWNIDGMTDCINNDWMLNYSSGWTMTPYSDMYSSDMIVFLNDLTPDAKTACDARFASPVAYLKSSVKISSGTGSESDPFVLEN